MRGWFCFHGLYFLNPFVFFNYLYMLICPWTWDTWNVFLASMCNLWSGRPGQTFHFFIIGDEKYRESEIKRIHIITNRGFPDSSVETMRAEIILDCYQIQICPTSSLFDENQTYFTNAEFVFLLASSTLHKDLLFRWLFYQLLLIKKIAGISSELGQYKWFVV